VLFSQKGRSGCFECLYRFSCEGPLGNRASLIRLGSHVERALAGCSTTFLPFGMSDASTVASLAVEMGCRAILEPKLASALVSKMGSWVAARAAGIEQSSRGATFARGELATETEFADKRCGVCAAASH
jgi:hypothetical protein